MKNKSPIPIEIQNFFADEYGKTLLIKGAPGSGKTVFALTLLSTLKGNGAYLSTRVDPDTLYMQHPWIKGLISPDNIVDATQSEREHATKTKEITIKPLKYTGVPDFLKAVYVRTEKMEKTIVIVDSWDAVASYTGYYEPKEKEKLEHNLCDFSRKTRTKVILLGESIRQTSLDYLVDGVIVIESDLYEERRLRRMFMQKLRGCEIRNPVRLFSLTEGIFKSFTEFRGVEMENPLIYDPIPDISDKRISTGIKDLDRVIKGYGNFNLFEGDHITYDILARALSINSLNLGRYLVFTSTKQNELISRISSYVKPEYRDNVEMIEDTKNLEERIKSDKEKFIIFLNLEEREDVDEVLKEAIPPVGERCCVVMCFGGREGGTGKEMDSIASTHIKTKFISGIPCIYGEMPRTEIYAMEFEPSTPEVFPVIALTPIV